MKGRSIVLVGFMGAGKSAVGRELARLLRCRRYDTDEMIRQRFTMTIPAFFQQHGEAAFRDAETAALREIIGHPAAIVVTGGGILMRPDNQALLASLGLRIWLDADEELLWRRVSRRASRPLLQGANPRENFSCLLRTRQLLYSEAADCRIDTTDLTIEQAAREVMKLYESERTA